MRFGQSKLCLNLDFEAGHALELLEFKMHKCLLETPKDQKLFFSFLKEIFLSLVRRFQFTRLQSVSAQILNSVSILVQFFKNQRQKHLWKPSILSHLKFHIENISQ